METPIRAYCWRTGGVFELDDDGNCPECGKWGKTHRRVPNDECGVFTQCPHDPDHGHPCHLLPGHEGPHETHLSQEDAEDLLQNAAD